MAFWNAYFRQFALSNARAYIKTMCLSTLLSSPLPHCIVTETRRALRFELTREGVTSRLYYVAVSRVRYGSVIDASVNVVLQD